LIGRRLGRGVIERHGLPLGLTPRRLAQVNRFFRRHGPKTVFVVRFITRLRVFCTVLAAAGLLRLPTFLLYNATGAVVWSTTIGLVGYALGESWDRLEQLVGHTGLIAFVVVIALFVLAVLRARRGSDLFVPPES